MTTLSIHVYELEYVKTFYESLIHTDKCVLCSEHMVKLALPHPNCKEGLKLLSNMRTALSSYKRFKRQDGQRKLC